MDAKKDDDVITIIAQVRHAVVPDFIEKRFKYLGLPFNEKTPSVIVVGTYNPMD